MLVSVKPQRHFGYTSGKVFQGSFCSERSICHPEQLTVVLEGVVAISWEWDLFQTGSTVFFPSGCVRTAPRRCHSLNASSVCVVIAEGSDRNSLILLCKHGVRTQGIGDTFANACYTLSSFERNSPQTSFFRSCHRTKRRTTVLSVLVQAD